MAYPDSPPSPVNSPAPIGIVIPTYNRVASLFQCLRHLEQQTCRDFEVLIADDGSTDSTRQQLESYRPFAPFPLQVIHQANSGAARARNLALARLRAPICILIGDDIFPAPNFVRVHLEFHREHPEPEAVALGLTRWTEQGQTVTPFMRWLDTHGVQFAYGDLLRGVSPDWRHFYTSNLSAKTPYLRQNPFHESFPKCGMEDIELGYRLSVEQHLAMHFLPEAVADHLHPTTFLRVCDRGVHVGEAAYTFGELWPEHRYSAPKGLLKRLLLPILTEEHVVLPVLKHTANLLTRFCCPNPLMKAVILLHERLGYQRAVAEAHSRTPKMSAAAQSL